MSANAKNTKTNVAAELGLTENTPTVKPAVAKAGVKPAVEKTEKQAPKAEKAHTATDAELAAQLLAGSSSKPNTANAGAGGRLTTDEVLHEYFSPTDLVTVRNPFDFDTGWVYSDPKDIVKEQPDKITLRIYGIGEKFQKVRILRAGKTITVPGWEAYVGITRFFKEWAQRSGDARAINNMELFRKFLGEVYVGIFDPNASQETSISASEALSKDLGLTGGNA